MLTCFRCEAECQSCHGVVGFTSATTERKQFNIRSTALVTQRCSRAEGLPKLQNSCSCVKVLMIISIHSFKSFSASARNPVSKLLQCYDGWAFFATVTQQLERFKRLTVFGLKNRESRAKSKRNVYFWAIEKVIERNIEISLGHFPSSCESKSRSVFHNKVLRLFVFYASMM